MDITGEGYEPVGSITDDGKPLDVKHDLPLRRLLQVAALCNNSTIYQSRSKMPKDQEAERPKNAVVHRQNGCLKATQLKVL